MTLTYGPCAGWDDPILCCTLTAAQTAVSGIALQAAAETLDMASGQQFGLCERTLRPCRRDCNNQSGTWWEWTGGYGALWPRPLLYNGQWFNLACGSCYGSCSCVGLEIAKLPGPVYGISQVLLHGSVMASGSYRVDEGTELLRIDGGMWPFCQDMSQPDDGPDAWAVTAVFGQPVPMLGRFALGELTCEYASALCGAECRLPANVVTAVKQGVTIQFDTDAPYYERLFYVKNFLDTFNPADSNGQRARGRAQAFDVDGPTYRRANTSAW